MDEQNKPNARKKRIVGEGKGIEKKGEALNIGPVGQSDNRPPQVAFQQSAQSAQNTQRPAQSTQSQSAQRTQTVQRPVQNVQTPNAQRPAHAANTTHRPVQSSQSSQNTQRPAQSPFGQSQSSQRTQQTGFGQSRPQSVPFGQSQQSGQSAQRPSQSTQSARPASARPSQSSRPASVRQNQSSGQGQRTGTSMGGGGGKILILIAAVVAFLLLGGKNLLFGGDDNSGSSTFTTTTTTQSQTQTQTGSSGSGSVMNLLSSFMGSTGSSSAYDFSGMLSGLLGGGSSSFSDLTSSLNTSSAASSSSSSGSGYQQYFTTTLENNSADVDTTVAGGSRDKYTAILGNGKDTMTILVYMCGADLESQNGMATSDLKEMVNADLSDKVNLLVYTGGARKWKNNVVSAGTNQIYRIKKGSLERLIEDDGNSSMTSPETLSRFIRYGKENYPANRMVLIFWDHGGGSVSGYGYDERYGKGQTMTLSGINWALKDGGVQFDFIGFDTCLMATLENGLMLNSYADYMIASEESEPGVGWYYTNWLSKVSKNTSMSTVQIGKNIVDDFVEVCDRQCRGQATTLSVVDLAELSSTVPKELTEFSVETNNLIQNKEYKKVSNARSKTREFATHAKIDQIDLVHFAKNLGTKEAKELASALQGAIKYNRTGGSISNAYGLSIYFPYKQAGTVKKAVSTFKEIGMNDEYMRCIQEFASLEVSGQLSSGSTPEGYGSGFGGSTGSGLSGLMESLMGGSNHSGGFTGGSSYSEIGGLYSGDGLESLLGGYLGGGSGSGVSTGSIGGTGSILDLLMGRSMTSEQTVEYIRENHFDPSGLEWKDGRISFTDQQWDNLNDIRKNLFFDDGNGYIDMGFDTDIRIEGHDLIYEFDGTWLSIDKQPVAYYLMGYAEQEECFAEIGYVPAIVNGTRANLILVFDMDNPYGYIAGAQTVYLNGETDTQPKTMIGIGKGDEIQFVCDYLDYKGNYVNSYRLGDPIKLGDEVEIANTNVDAEKCRLSYMLTDIYQQKYWTPVM